jgi:hypothetical protein
VKRRHLFMRYDIIWQLIVSDRANTGDSVELPNPVGQVN